MPRVFFTCRAAKTFLRRPLFSTQMRLHSRTILTRRNRNNGSLSSAICGQGIQKPVAPYRNGLAIACRRTHGSRKYFCLWGLSGVEKALSVASSPVCVGTENVAGPTLSSISQQFGLQTLIEKQLAIISDARLGSRADQSLIAERLLSISGEDMLSVPRKYAQDWHGTLRARFMLMTNELPRLSDTSGALASRFIILNLAESFYGQEDTDLLSRFLSELPGILNWAIEGWQRLQKRGHFVQPRSSVDTVQELEDLGSPVAAFVRERCAVGPEEEIETLRLYHAYQAWCESQGWKFTSDQVRFGRDLRAAVPGVQRGEKWRRKEHRERVYKGIALKTQGAHAGARR